MAFLEAYGNERPLAYAARLAGIRVVGYACLAIGTVLGAATVWLGAALGRISWGLIVIVHLCAMTAFWLVIRRARRRQHRREMMLADPAAAGDAVTIAYIDELGAHRASPGQRPGDRPDLPVVGDPT